ncbi:MAG: hypothetical protein GX621_08500 [Pirellulaceae bacterium]|nr:hypothetical protein [Pirellulaceae bacterium]
MSRAESTEATATDAVRTMNANIRLFLRDKKHVSLIRLEHATEDVAWTWDQLGCTGDRDAAIKETTIKHGATKKWKR